MKNTKSELLSHISQEVITTSYCWKITLANNDVIGLTDCDHDLEIENVSYHSNPGAKLKFISSGANVYTAQTEILTSPLIGEASLRHGLLDSAQVEIFLVNYENVSHGAVSLFEGIIRETTVCNNKIMMQLLGTMCVRLTNKVGGLFSPQCRAQFCDTACKLNEQQFTSLGHISEVLNKYKTFKDQSRTEADCYYQHGVVKFLTGNNSQISVGIRNNYSNTVHLESRVPHPLKVGDQYSILAGCDKNFRTCVVKFKNAENFRGEPHVPDPHSIYQPSD